MLINILQAQDIEGLFIPGMAPKNAPPPAEAPPPAYAPPATAPPPEAAPPAGGMLGVGNGGGGGSGALIGGSGGPCIGICLNKAQK
jgi:hypothetical protein